MPVLDNARKFILYILNIILLESWLYSPQNSFKENEILNR